jgi:chemotaxis signal transduction protein
MSKAPELEGKAAALRRAFDQAFAVPPQPAAQEVTDLLAIRVAGVAHAIKLREIAAIVTKRTLIAVPAAAPDLLGLAGIRGGIVPVFGLASILGYAVTSESPPWMVLCGTDEPIALAFAAFDGYLRVPTSSLHADQSVREIRPYVRELASTEEGVRAVVDVSLVVTTIRTRTDRNVLAKELHQ